MNKDDVARFVREGAGDMVQEGIGKPYDGYVVNPVNVLHVLRERRPDAVRRITRFDAGDPYQKLKVWVPRSSL